MMSLFEDEDFLYRSRMPFAKLPDSGSKQVQLISGNPKRHVQKPEKRKRTVYEALERIYNASPPDFEAAGLYALARPTRKPFMIYNAARVGAAGLVIIDPLDRLEGGIID